MLEVQLTINNKFGEFRGKFAKMKENDVERLIEMSRSFYNSGGFELTCEDGSFVIFPPDIVKESMLKIIVKEINE